MSDQYQDYGFASTAPRHMHVHFLPAIFALAGPLKPGLRVLDVGCGNGFTAGEFLKRDCQVVGVDLSEQGITLAKETYPTGRFEVLAADDHLLENLGEEPFDLIVSTEVVEHLYAPKAYARGCYAALKPGGHFICTTPYHGYLKNLLLSLFNKWDTHANPLWDGGHIKLWSRLRLEELLTEAGFKNFAFRGAGRVPFVWMTMAVRAKRPSDSAK